MKKLGTTGLRVLFVALPVLALMGCSHKVVKPQGPDYSQLMQQAQASRSAHDIEGAKNLYHQAADADPTRGAPWLQLAKINFNQQEYGRSIVARGKR